jgi:RNA polymerase sigma-70 factor (ECF subfamily)
VRNLPRPLTGAKKIAAFFASVGRKGGASFETREYQLNGQPAIVAFRDGEAFVAILISVANGKIRHVFIQADPARLTHIGLSH